MLTIDDYKQWLDSFFQLGLPAISVETSARVLAVVCTLGNNEQMDHCPQLMADIEYMRKAYHLNGGEVPEVSIVKPLQKYIAEIEDSGELPEWAEELFKQRYGVKIYK